MCQYNDKRIIVAIPCHNEELTIEKVISDFKKELPGADIVVVDNCSVDKSVEFALNSGARVMKENRLGKGWAIKAIFERLDADIYIIVDGDDTYYSKDVHKLIAPVLEESADMAVGSRLHNPEEKAFSLLHVFGNHLFAFFLNKLFKASFKDILSGYRVFSRNFVNRIPLITGGFQTETEMTIQAIEKKMIVKEVSVSYRPRPKGGVSKINTFKDGWLILLTMAMYMRDHNPLRFFCHLSLAWIIVGEVLFARGLFVKLSANSAAVMHGIIFLGALLLSVGGMVMSAVNTRFRELDATLRKLIKEYDGGKKL